MLEAKLNKIEWTGNDSYSVFFYKVRRLLELPNKKVSRKPFNNLLRILQCFRYKYRKPKK